MDSNKRFDFTSLVTGLGLIAVSVLVLANPAATFVTISMVLGVVALLRGAQLLFSYYKLRQLADIRIQFTLAAGLLLVIAGLVLLLAPGVLGSLLGFLIAAWFIVDAASSLFRLNIVRPFGDFIFYLTLFLSLLLLIGGVVLLFNPMFIGSLISVVVGISLLASGIQCILMAFMSKSS